MIKLVSYDDPELFQGAEEFPLDDKEERYRVQKAMIYFMFKNGIIHLSGPNIGINKRIIVLATQPNLVLFNPVIRWTSDRMISLEETCHNMYNVIVPIKRPDEIRVFFQTASGESEARTFGGLTARYILHNMDYLNGVKFYSRASRYHRDKVEKKLKSMKRKDYA